MFFLDIDEASPSYLESVYQRRVSSIDGLKVGDKILASGASWILAYMPAWYKKFIDLKLYDTAARIAREVTVLRKGGVYALTISGDAGKDAIVAGVAERGDINIVVTTVLSSWDNDYCFRQYNRSIKHQLFKQYDVALEAQAQMVTCPAWLLPALSNEVHDHRLPRLPIFATGIRHAGQPAGGHVNPKTPSWAMEQGATYVVAGVVTLGLRDTVAMK